MFDSEPFPVSFPCFVNPDAHLGMDGEVDDLRVYDLPNVDCFRCPSQTLISTDGSFDSSPVPFIDYMPGDEFDHRQLLDLPPNVFELNLEELESFLDEDIECMKRWLEDSQDELRSDPDDGSRSTASNGASSIWSSSNELQVNLPMEFVEAGDNKLVSLHHLSMAYGEALENENAALADVIRPRICEKVSPVDGPLERALYYTLSSSTEEFEYLKQESAKNFSAAFQALCQMLPYATVAHSVANSAILEAIPSDDDTVVRIYDFDIGEGLQWSSLIEAVGQQCQCRKTVKLTSVRWGDEDGSGQRGPGPSPWRFEETKERLEDLARENGFKLEVNEVELHDLESEVEKAMNGGRREVLAFNCTVGIPHMGRRRQRSQAVEFLRVARDSIANLSSNKGIVAFVDGDGWRRPRNSLPGNFKTSFENYIDHYRSLLESMETGIPCRLREARIAMETLFVAPLMSMDDASGRREPEEEAEELWFLGLNGYKASNESLVEAKEIVREGESLYRFRAEGDGNVAVLEWRGTPLMKISLWR